jgi:hypothetical protein
MTLVEREFHYFNLLESGMRFGVEYLVVDLKYSTESIRRLVQLSGRTKIIGQYLARDVPNWTWDDAARLDEYAKAEGLGCNMVRFVKATADPRDNHAVSAFLRKVDTISGHLPVSTHLQSE